MDTIKIGWVGCGYHSYNLLFDCLRNTPARVVAACDADPARLALFAGRYNIAAQYADYVKMLDKEALDAVICVINADMHYEVAKACLLKGVCVFVEKTPCRTAAQAEELAALQEKSGAFAMTGFNRRHAVGYAMLKRIADSDEFGRKTMYLAKYNASGYKSEEFYIFNHIVHHLDLARFLLGEITLTHADRVWVSDRQVGFHISFRSDAGAIGTLQSGSLQYIEYPMERVEITGVGTNAILDNMKRLEYNRPTTKKRNTAEALLRDGFDTLSWNHNHGNLIENDLNGFKDEIETFVECVRENKAPAETFADSVHTMRVLEHLRAMLQ
ncbi:MAG: Gfo/Idh/MocA family oxidoreductase [Oscillospiraceae bacterium]|nr:Gfo/Idh/MocA family oxidoreductase [Oscillospiraceae bacterium]